MAKFLTEVRGFTPVIDVVVQDVGLVAAAVYGVMWRYCQMEDHVCKAALATIAERIGLDRRTVRRYVAVLVKAGYVNVVSDIEGVPRVYADAGRAKITGLLGVTESPTPGTECLGGVGQKVLGGRTESPTKIVLREQAREKKEETAAAASVAVTCSIHNKPMTLKNKDGDAWYSHQLADGTWCKGAPGDQPTTRPDSQRYITGEYSDLIQH